MPAPPHREPHLATHMPSCPADLDSGISQFVTDGTDEQSAGSLTVTETGVLTDAIFVGQDQMQALFPDAQSTRITGRM